MYEQCSSKAVSLEDNLLYQKLTDAQYYVEDDFDERNIILYNRLSQKLDSTLYHIVINTTLSCNLQCWYCYEHKLKGSFLKEDVLMAVEKNIMEHYENHPYLTLKVSFFGGEPFMNFNAIKRILSFAKSFCEDRHIHLIADFTTNATLITTQQIDFLKDYQCLFQITLDGNKTQHNQVKKWNDKDTYQITLSHIQNLVNLIPNIKLWIRINYDEKTLRTIEDTIKDISSLDKQKVFIIMRKIWQVSAAKIKTSLLLEAIQKEMDAGFYVDCYPLSTDRLCFAERINQVLFNIDGKVFKCSTIPSFDESQSYGKLNMDSGEIVWNKNKLALLTKNLYTKKCQNCALFGTCYGACNKSIHQHPNSDFCILQEINMSLKEYLMYNFKSTLLQNKLFN